jgi:uncharacterized integral membrane protein
MNSHINSASYIVVIWPPVRLQLMLGLQLILPLNPQVAALLSFIVGLIVLNLAAAGRAFQAQKEPLSIHVPRFTFQQRSRRYVFYCGY